MPKRMIDTNLFKKKIMRDNKKEIKLFWIYLFVDCSFAGIWEVDFEVASIYIGSKISKEDLPIDILNKVIFFNEGTKAFIPEFIYFQYIKLNESNPMHRNIIKELDKYNLYDHETKDLKLPEQANAGRLRPADGAKETDKEEEEDMEEEEETDNDMDKMKGIEEEILLYLNTKALKNFKAVPFNLKFIKARLIEGYTLENFITVINKKVEEWLTNDDMNKYLRPETLFGNKFDAYLNQVNTTPRQIFKTTNKEWDNILQWFNSGLLESEEKICNLQINGHINEEEKKYLLNLLREEQ